MIYTCEPLASLNLIKRFTRVVSVPVNKKKNEPRIFVAAKIATTTKQVIKLKEGRLIAYEGAKKMLGLE